MNAVCILIALVLTSLLRGCGPSSSNQEPAVNKISSPFVQLDSLIHHWIDSTSIPGLSVAITHDDSIIYLKSFGVKNLESKEPLQPINLFHVASVSKPFMATAIMQLVERGKIELDERLVTYLPYFKMADERYKAITIRQMLNHTSGFPDVEDYEWEHPQKDDGAAERYARSLGSENLVSTPGIEFHYSNMAFDVLAAVVAKVSGESFEAFVKNHILQPLEMNESSFYQPETHVALRTTPHTGKPPRVSKIYPYNRSHAPSSTLNSSAAEMSHWTIANLHEGNYKGERILQPYSYKTLMTPGFVINKEENVAIGLSWFIHQYKGHSLIGHSGSDLGYRSILTLIPDRKMGIIILANWDQTPVNVINNSVLDILLNMAK